MQSIVELASAFGLTVIGEGIETESQAIQRRALGCNLGQGFLFTPALPADEFGAMLSKQRANPNRP